MIAILQEKLRDTEARLAQTLAERKRESDLRRSEVTSAEVSAPMPAVDKVTKTEANESNEPIESNEPATSRNAEILEKDAEKIEQGIEEVVHTVQEIKDSIPDERSRRVVEEMVKGLYAEKVRFNEHSKALTANLRKKEFDFRNQEARLIEELRQARALSHQRQSTVERMKELMVEMQQRLTKDKASQGQSNANEAQIRIKYEQSQRQIDALNKEIERLGRRAQLQTPAASGGAVSTARASTEFQKQAEAAQKALTAKKQEIELMKRQLNEKDAKEAEYKRTLLRMQNELNALKQPAKKSA